MKKRLWSVLLTTAITASAFGVNAGAEESAISGELNIMHYIAEASKLEAFDEIVEGFKEEYPDVEVNSESTTLDNYQDIIKLKISTGDAPDIIFGSPKTYTNLIESGNIADLTEEEFMERFLEEGKRSAD